MHKNYVTVLYLFFELVLSFSVGVWFGNLNLAERNRLGRLVSIAGKVIGVNQS